MKDTLKLFTTFFIVVFALQSVTAGNPPTFNLTVKNILTFPGSPPFSDRDSILTFEVYCQLTNFGGTGVDPFEFCCAQYAWYFNKNSAPAGTIPTNAATITASAFIPSYVGLLPSSSQVIQDYDGTNGLIQFSGNLPNSSLNYFISPVFPGTFFMKVKLRTTAHSWNFVPLNLRFKLGSAPNTFLAYLLPYPDTVDTETIPPPQQFAQVLLDTVANQYSVECNVLPPFYSCALPVELTAFISGIDRNIVSLNWTTVTEINNSGFEIERSSANKDSWERVGFVEGFGTTDEPKDYSFKETVNSGSYNYRLKQIDFNGGFSYYPLNNEVVVGIPAAYAISQNYPNPFNPSTRIDFELPYDGKVSILLYDISGREVAKLTNDVLHAGYHNIQFNGSNIASGMYFYRINAQGGTEAFIATKKMVLIK